MNAFDSKDDHENKTESKGKDFRPHRLILSIAHRPLPNNLLNKLIQETSSKSKQMIEEMEGESYGCDIGEERDNKTVHVLLTGSPSCTQPGRFFKDWETSWSTGEVIFAKFINKLGLQYFNCIPEPGGVRLYGKLVDVKQTDFRYFSSSSSSTPPSSSDDHGQQLHRELVWIAKYVKSYFKLYALTHVSELIIIYPFGTNYHNNDNNTDEKKEGDMHNNIDIDPQDLQNEVNAIFEREWGTTSSEYRQQQTIPDGSRTSIRTILVTSS